MSTYTVFIFMHDSSNWCIRHSQAFDSFLIMQMQFEYDLY